jgi:hypothetical protein
MDKVCKIFTGVIVMIIVTSLPLWADSEWEEIRNRNGVKVSSMRVEDCPMNRFKAECIIDAPLEVVYEVVMDPGSYVNWFHSCTDRRVIKKFDENNGIGYQVVNLPFPLRDRDTVATMYQDVDWAAGKLKMKMDAIKPPEDSKYGMDELTKKKGRVRMPIMIANIVLNRITPGKTEMIYMAHADPGAPVPAWILNFFSTGHPYKTLLGIQKEVKKEIYYKRAEKKHNKKFVMKSHIE